LRPDCRDRPSRPAVLGDEVRLRLARFPRPQAERPVSDKELPVNFPSIDELVKWPSISESFFFNKIVLINLIAVLLTVLFFALANKRQMVPRGLQNLGESAVNFIDEGIVQQTIGAGGEKYIPYITTIFFFVFFTNIFEIMPVISMPANARM